VRADDIAKKTGERKGKAKKSDIGESGGVKVTAYGQKGDD